MNRRRLPILLVSGMLVLAALACAAPSPGLPFATPTKSTPVVAPPTAGPTVAGTASPQPTASAPPTAKPQPTARPQPAASSDCANSYFPVKAGATWTYANTGSVGPDSTTTRTFTNLAAAKFVVKDETTPDIRVDTLWTCQAGNLAMFQGATISFGSGADGGFGLANADSATGYLIPATIKAGQAWSERLSVQTHATVGGKHPGELTQQNDATIGCTGEGDEAVKVAAGSFQAAKVTCVWDMTTVSTINGQTGDPVHIHLEISDWYAPGVGSVKKVTTGDLPQTKELTSYSIP